MPALVYLAGCSALPHGDGDEADLLVALSELDCEARWIVWDDPDNRAHEADLVVLRATWDYAERRAEFLDWCASVPNLLNPAGVVRWNLDKSYLLDLAGTGLPIVPTEVIHPGERPRWPETEFVVKPVVGAGSRGARRFAAGSWDGAEKHLASVHGGGVAALVQPYQPRVDSEGETAMVYVSGAYSHAFRKGPMLAGGDWDGSGLFASEKLAVAEPGPATRRLAEDTLDAASGVLGIPRRDLLYARVDVVSSADGRPLLLELELSEPSLGLTHAGGDASARFASAIRSRLRS
ncbi:hypothetical protein H0B56_10330 [Haloechinothrix sp. YIM 98757]|uniref:ATP-grasp domain-containing protein n=1 Tax=Haloechinothrix aidingensis TaxID=2752311 RepID=A0A838A901_9PSEU|nr:hypothetical protein [Haloechinothrix aidingensis]MBA0125938.1 hypothetical protein [Haloechinothrix aidingensis]